MFLIPSPRFFFFFALNLCGSYYYFTFKNKKQEVCGYDILLLIIKNLIYKNGL